MGGAKQWRIKCPHIQDRPSETCMASEITANNKGHWAREDRVPEGVDADDLGNVLERADGDTGVVCNSCRRVLILGDDRKVVYGPDPHYSVVGHPGDPHSDWGSKA
jgi:hypothetical protein